MNEDLKKELFPMAVAGVASSVVVVLGLYVSGIMVPSHVATSAVAQARIDVRATLCKEAALASLAESGTVLPVDEKGLTTRESRDALVTAVLATTGDKTKDHLIHEACRDKLAT